MCCTTAHPPPLPSHKPASKNSRVLRCGISRHFDTHACNFQSVELCCEKGNAHSRMHARTHAATARHRERARGGVYSECEPTAEPDKECEIRRTDARPWMDTKMNKPDQAAGSWGRQRPAALEAPTLLNGWDTCRVAASRLSQTTRRRSKREMTRETLNICTKGMRRDEGLRKC